MNIKTCMQYYLLPVKSAHFFSSLASAADKDAGNELTHAQGHASKAIPLLQLFPKEKL